MRFISTIYTDRVFNKWLGKPVEKVNGRSSRLLFLYNHIAGQQIVDQQYAGEQTVSLAQIKGTASAARCVDFDGNFRLINKQGQQRLTAVANAWRRKILPPVNLIQVGDTYFVQDGHHRVSVASTNHQEHIKAHITVLQLADIAGLRIAISS